MAVWKSAASSERDSHKDRYELLEIADRRRRLNAVDISRAAGRSDDDDSPTASRAACSEVRSRSPAADGRPIGDHNRRDASSSVTDSTASPASTRSARRNYPDVRAVRVCLA